IGRIVPNFIGDIWGPFNALITCTFACAIISICMLAATNTAGIIAIAVLYGLFSGAFLPNMSQKLGTHSHSFPCGLAGTPITGALLTTDLHWNRPIAFSAVRPLFYFTIHHEHSLIDDPLGLRLPGWSSIDHCETPYCKGKEDLEGIDAIFEERSSTLYPIRPAFRDTLPRNILFPSVRMKHLLMFSKENSEEVTLSTHAHTPLITNLCILETGQQLVPRIKHHYLYLLPVNCKVLKVQILVIARTSSKLSGFFQRLKERDPLLALFTTFGDL
ncbi:14628_t:CDS:2, partial [Acaulospora colombiana]